MFVTVFICGANLCYGAAAGSALQTEKLPTAGIKLPPGLLQKLRAPVPRQTLINALLANPTTKSFVADAIGSSGAGKARMGALSTARTSATLSNVAAAAMAGDADFKKLDWKAGFTFLPYTVPTYGSGNWKLGVYSLRTVDVRTYLLETAIVDTYSRDYGFTPITLLVEMPADPGLYAITMKLMREDGKCLPSWVMRYGSNYSEPIIAYYWQLSESASYFSGSKIPLTPLPDGTGFAGLITALATSNNDGSDYGMRRYTSQIEVYLSPKAIKPGEYLGKLYFGGLTITRL